MNKDIKKILVIVAHPDDAELMFGGIIHHYTTLGVEVNLIVVTDGSSWSTTSNDPKIISKTRRKEQTSAAKMLGVKEVFFLNMPDAFIKSEHIEKPLLNEIRKINPNIILTHSQNESHSDHKEIYKAVKRLCNFIDEPALITNPFIECKYPPVDNFCGLYTHVKIDDISKPNTYFFALQWEDIDAKLKAIKKYKSQFSDSNIQYKVTMDAQFLGRLISLDYAEAIKEEPMHRYSAINDFKDIR